MWVMIRTLEGRLTSQVPSQLISLVMSGEISPDLSPLLSENKFQHIYHRKVKAKKKNLEKSGAKLDESSTQAGDFSVLPELRTRSRPLSALYVTYGASSLSSLQNDQG